MKEENKPAEPLFEGVKRYYNRKSLLILFACAAFAVATTYLQVQHYEPLPAEYESNHSGGFPLAASITILLFGAIALASLTYLERKKRKGIRLLQNYIENPHTLISYKLVAGDVAKLSLTGETNMRTLRILNMQPLQIEAAIFETFPHLQKGGAAKDALVVLSTPSSIVLGTADTVLPIDRATLLRNVPKALKPYVGENFSPKAGCLPFTLGILLAFMLVSFLSYLGWFNFSIFKEGNMYWGYAILPVLALSLVLYRTYKAADDKKLHQLLKTPENVAWIYLEKTKDMSYGIPGSTTTRLMVADVHKKYSVLLSAKQEETLAWLSLYCPSAIVGFYYEWDEIYEKNPKEFVKLIHTKFPRNESKAE